MLSERIQCKGKNCYDKKGAMTALNFNKGNLRGHTKLSIYHCDICNWWHLTSHNKKHKYYGQQKNQEM